MYKKIIFIFSVFFNLSIYAQCGSGLSEPTVTIAQGNIYNMCQEFVDLNENHTNDSNGVVWSKDSGSGNINSSSGNVSNMPKNSSGVFIATAQNGTCTATDTITVYNRTPEATYAAGAGTFCGSTTITASGGAGGTIYFQGTTNNGTSTSTPSNSVVVSSSGNYFFRSYNAIYNCWGEQGSVYVTIQDPPTAPTSLTSFDGDTLCSGKTTTLYYSGGSNGSGANFEWYTGACGSGTYLGNVSSLTINPTSTTTYYMRRVGTNAPCNFPTSCVSITVYVLTPPTAPTSISSSAGTNICGGTTTTLSFNGGNDGSGATYEWYEGGCGNGAIIGTGVTIDVTPSSSTSYYVRRVGIGPCSTPTNCANISINVQTPPTAPTNISSSAGNTICVGTNTTLSFSGGSNGSGANYQWFKDGCGSGTVLGTGNTLNVSPTTTTSYYVRRVGVGSCASYTTACTSITINVDQNPSTAIAGPNASSCLENTYLMAANDPVVGTGNWTWSPSSITYMAGTTSSDYNAQIQFNSSGTYTGTWTISNGACPSSSDGIEILVNTPATIVLADATATCESNSINDWVHLYDDNGFIIASIHDNNQDLGDVTASVYYHNGSPFKVNTTSGSCGAQAVLNRNFVINTTIAPSNNVKIRFYFTDNELLYLQSLAGCGDANGCADDDDVCGITDLVVTQIDDLNPSEEDGVFDPGAGYSIFHAYPANSGIGNNSYNANYLEISTSSFSEFWIHGSEHNISLPVELTKFEASAYNNEYIQLTWTTATEINNEGFQVEKSTNGIDFNSIGFVNGNGNSNSIISYQFIDSEVNNNETYYYRLKQIDYDGVFEYSHVENAALNNQVDFLIGNMIPNPSKENQSISVDVSILDEEMLDVYIFSAIGEKIYSNTFLLNEGANQLELNTSHLSSGTYFVNFVGSFGRETKKIVVIK